MSTWLWTTKDLALTICQCHAPNRLLYCMHLGELKRCCDSKAWQRNKWFAVGEFALVWEYLTVNPSLSLIRYLTDGSTICSQVNWKGMYRLSWRCGGGRRAGGGMVRSWRTCTCAGIQTISSSSLLIFDIFDTLKLDGAKRFWCAWLSVTFWVRLLLTERNFRLLKNIPSIL